MSVTDPIPDEQNEGGTDAGYMQIGEVAHRTGLTQRALRYYESVGLLAPASRMEGGFRLYSQQDVARLERIVELKRLLGFSLAEIRQVLEADDLLRQIRSENKQETDPEQRRTRLGRAMAIVNEQLALVRSRIESMRDLEASYVRRLERLRSRLAALEPRAEAPPDADAAPPALASRR